MFPKIFELIRERRIKTKLIFGFGYMIILILVSSVLLIFTMKNFSKFLENTNQGSQSKNHLLQKLNSHINDIAIRISAILVLGDSLQLLEEENKMHEAFVDFNSKTSDYEKFILSSEEKELITTLTNEIENLKLNSASIIDYGKQSKKLESQSVYFLNVHPLAIKMKVQINDLYMSDKKRASKDI